MADLQRGSAPAATSCSAGAGERRAEIARTGRAGLPARDPRGPRGRLAGGARAGGPRRPAGRDHRPDRAQDGDQRAQLRRQGVAGRPRGRQHPALGQRRRRPGQPRTTRSAGTHRLHRARRASTTRCGRRRPLPRSSCCGRAAGTSTSGTCSVDGRPMVGALVDFGLYFFHNAAELLRRGSGPYFYLPKMESHLEARLWNDVFTYAQERARHPARHRPGDRADRDHPGRVRDGRDPLRAARPRRRAERRPLGLPVQHHQELPRRRARRSCCPTGTRSP